MEPLRVGSLCTGIGGLDLAVDAAYGPSTLSWCAEVEAGPCSIIEREHPDTPNLGDLTVIDWASLPRVDVLTAGYPCQPFSHAGLRKGTDDVRHLWPYIADAVRVLRPRRVVLENVAGHLSLGFDRVLGDLAEAGFDAEWCLLRASDVGACHQRARLFIVARDADRSREDALAAPGASRLVAGERCGSAPDVDRARLEGPEPARGRNVPAGSDRAPADFRGQRPADSGHPAADADRDGSRRLAEQHGETTAGLDGPPGRHADGRGLEAARRPSVGADEPAVEWGAYRPAIERWAAILGRPAPAPTDTTGRLSPTFVEWMMGYPEGWTADLGRTAALKALGNAVCAQQAEAAIRLLEHPQPVGILGMTVTP